MLAAEILTCPHFGICGGCAVTVRDGERASPAPYPDQLREKESRVRALLAPFDIAQWRPILPSPDVWYYRNKMEYAFAPAAFTGVPEGVVLGLREPARFDRIVDLERCLLMSPDSFEALRLTREWARRHQLIGYDRRSHQGHLRYLMIREGKNTRQRMLVLVVTTSFANHYTDAIAELPGLLGPLSTTAWLAVTDARGDMARAEDMRLQWGPGTIDETLGDIRYRVSPYSFFQTNTHGAERLYGLLSDWARGVGGGALVDLYCGSGGITLALAKGFDRAVGIDSNREAIEDATYNAAANGLTNIEFITGDVLDFIKKLPASKLAVQLSAVVVDPPRPGLHPKALQALVEMNPPRLAYVSCNPESLARDLQTLAVLYNIISVQPVDMFPQTTHLETVVLMEHR